MQTEPETLTAADVADIKDTRKPDPYLDGVADYLKGGALLASQIIMRVFQNPEPDIEALKALCRQMEADPRFTQADNGEWDLVGLPAAEGKSIGDCMAANESNADKLADAEPPFGEAAPVAPIEGTGSETIASEAPSPAAVVAAAIMDAGAETIARLRAELTACRDELDAYKDRAAQEKVLTDAIVKKGAEVVAAKEVLAGKKAALATAHEELFAFVSGDTQTEHPDLRADDDEDDDSGDDDRDDRPARPEPPPLSGEQVKTIVTELAKVQADGARIFLHPVAADQHMTDHGLDLLRLRALLRALLRREIIPSEKPLQVGPAIVELKGCQWLVRDCNDEQTKWFLQRVLSQDDWQQTHEKEFGRAVKGFDQNDEARNQRQLGGTECGLVVKVGRKVGVLGPEREGLVLTVEVPKDAPPAEDAPADGKSAGAGDGLRDEQEQFVAGDTPGGVVNSDPND